MSINTQPIYANPAYVGTTNVVQAAQEQSGSIYKVPVSRQNEVDLSCKDGKNDGKIGFGEALWSGIKGIGKSIVNTVVGIATDPKKLLLTAGAIALSIVCPPAGIALCAIGAVSGAVQIGKGVYNATQAETDEQAKMAFEDIGGGALAVGVSVLGAKAGLKAMKGVEGSAMSSATGIKGTVKAYGTDLASSIKGGAGYETTSLAARAGNVKTGIENTKIVQNIKEADFSGNKLTAAKDLAQKTVSDYKEVITTKAASQAATKTAVETAKANVSAADDLMAAATTRAETDIAAGLIAEADAALAAAEAAAVKPTFLQSTGAKASQINSAITQPGGIGYFGLTGAANAVNTESTNTGEAYAAAGVPLYVY